MKKKLIILLISFLLIGCSSIRRFSPNLNITSPTIIGVSNNETYNNSVTITVQEQASLSYFATIDNVSYTLGSAYNIIGDKHVLVVTAVDILSSLDATTTIEFSLVAGASQTATAPVVTGVLDFMTYTGSVTINVTEENNYHYYATINDQDYTLGSAYSEVGNNHVLVVNAVDIASKATASTTVTFNVISEVLSGEWVSVNYQVATYNNPLKGFMPYKGMYSNMPYSLEFFYISLRDLMSGPNTFHFAEALEPTLNQIAERGNQAVVRVYLDYPGLVSGVPQYLIDAGLTLAPYTEYGGGLSPDYENQSLLTALDSFIAAFGEQYDGDPRIGFIQTGTIGFWGEWHTYPYDGVVEQPNLMASETTQIRVLTAYRNAFSQTKLLTRYPAANSVALNYGYHDDMFAFNTLPTIIWHFMSKINAANVSDRWKTEPIGGEIAPAIQISLWSHPTGNGNEDYYECVDTTHASWMLNHDVFVNDDFTGTPKNLAIEGANRMGYKFAVSSYYLEVNKTQKTLSLIVKIVNNGVAPFYYDWPVEIGITDTNKTSLKLFDTNWKISNILPDEGEFSFSWNNSDNNLDSGTYYIMIRVPNPMPSGKPIKFHNTNQDRDLDDWITLGSLEM
jgi:hypothetical protein